MTEKELELRHWLNRAFYADKKAKALEMLVEQCRERSQRLTVCWEGNDSGRKSGSQNGTEEAIMKLIDVSHKAAAQRLEAVSVLAEIQERITTLKDYDLEAVLIHRYLLFHTDSETAEIMHYDERTIRRKRQLAIEKLSGCVL